MSKRELKKYLIQLTKQQLEEQLLELYEKFIPVKTYYDFAFNPKEDKLIELSRVKIANEYYPIKGKRPKARRSTAQKFIKHFITLGVDSYRIADVMFYSIEIAQTYSSEKDIKQELFFKSMFSSFNQAVNFVIEKGILADFQTRISAIKETAFEQKWFNYHEFEAILERIE
jgi:hypothetical protein